MRMVALLLASVAAACGTHRGSGTGADANPGGFRCGAATCGVNQFCFDAVLGVTPATPTQGCNTLPIPCSFAATCQCVMANLTVLCNNPTCSAVNREVTVVCPQP
jgi:hypothetical protein